MHTLFLTCMYASRNERRRREKALQYPTPKLQLAGPRTARNSRSAHRARHTAAAVQRQKPARYLLFLPGMGVLDGTPYGAPHQAPGNYVGMHVKQGKTCAVNVSRCQDVYGRLFSRLDPTRNPWVDCVSVKPMLRLL